MFWHTVLYPVTAVLSAALVGAHKALTWAGLDPSAAPVWILAICLLVIAVRIALLPLVVRQVRLAHASVRAYPEQAKIRARFAGRTDPTSLQRQAAELREVNGRHGIGAAATLPLFIQLPVVSAVFLLLRDVSAGMPVASISAELVASAGQAGIGGVQLGSTVTSVMAAGSVTAVAGLLTLCVVLGVLAYASQRFLVMPNLAEHALDGPFGQVQEWLPALIGVGAVVGAAVVPAGVVVYLLANSLWSTGQQAAITRFWPTPTSAAARRLA